MAAAIALLTRTREIYSDTNAATLRSTIFDTNTYETSGGEMSKHIVMWNVRGETREQKHEAALLVKNSFESLIGKVAGLQKLEVGLDVSGIDYACDVVLYTEFESQESLDYYAFHPDHARVKEELSDVRIARHQVDYI